MESCPIFFQGVLVPGLSIFFEKYFVFSTPPEPFGGFKEKSYYINLHTMRVGPCSITVKGVPAPIILHIAKGMMFPSV
jgi:hypothetical protein